MTYALALALYPAGRRYPGRTRNAATLALGVDREQVLDRHDTLRAMARDARSVVDLGGPLCNVQMLTRQSARVAHKARQCRSSCR